MKYQNSAAVAQAHDEPLELDVGLRLSDANINPSTGLATDYLNRFNEAVMLLDMLATCPEFRDDFLSWEPMSYREHFRASHSRTRDLTIAAYETADPNVRGGRPVIAGTGITVMNVVLANTTGDKLTPHRIAQGYGLSLGQVYAALAYYHLHQTELDEQIQREMEETEQLVAELERQGKLKRIE